MIDIVLSLDSLSSPAVVGELAKKMLGFNLITKQTPKDGVKVKTVSQTGENIHFPLSYYFLYFLSAFVSLLLISRDSESSNTAL